MYNVFITLNPHIINLSQDKLREDFSYILKKYYRKLLGQRHYKHKDKQYPLNFVIEKGKKFVSYIDDNHIKRYIVEKNIDINAPHLHIMMNVPLAEIKNFVRYIRKVMRIKYNKLTTDFQFIKTNRDEANVYTYCLKEDVMICSNNDLY